MPTLYFSRQVTTPNTANGNRDTVNSLWASDGTAVGTRLVRNDIFRDTTTLTHIEDITPFRGGIAFSTPSGNVAGRTGLWFSDGTTEGTSRLVATPGQSVVAGLEVDGLTNFGGTLLFGGANVQSSFGLWTSDGTVGGTRELADIYRLGINELEDFTSYNGSLYFIAKFQEANILGRPNGVSAQNVYRYDGAGATRIDLEGTGDLEMTEFNGALYVRYQSNVFSSRDISRITGDGAPRLLTDAETPAPLLSQDLDNIVELASGVLYAGSSGAAGSELLIWSGAGAGTLVRDINPGSSGSDVRDLTVVNGIAYFGATTVAGGRELWRSDGTAAGTFQVADIAGGTASSNPGNLQEFDGLLYFTTTDGGLWRTDGTAVGTERIASGVDVDTGFGFDAVSRSGGVSNDVLVGTDRNDVFRGNGGDDRINGGAGLDTAAYRGDRAGYALSRDSSGNLTVSDRTAARDGNDILAGVERLRFTDGTIAFDTTGSAGQGYRLYQAAFDRTPDQGGLSFWVGRLDQGTSLLDVARGFLASAEAQSVYGSNPTSSSFVSLLYQNVLGRAGEAGGVAFWTAQLDSGARSRAEVLAGFSESSENVTLVAPAIQNGIWLDLA